MPLMSKKKQPFIIDENLSAALKPYLPADSRTTVECGLPKGTKDYPWIMDLCQRKKAMLVTADLGFCKHVARYQRERNDCCWGLLLLPDNEGKQIELLKKLGDGKIKLKHPVDDEFHFDAARHENLCVNSIANPPQVTELCNCEWDDY
jgi:predicted nuclease of predicted toxin-antitoxin system